MAIWPQNNIGSFFATVAAKEAFVQIGVVIGWLCRQFPHAAASARWTDTGWAGGRCRIRFVSVRHDTSPRPAFPTQ